MADAVPAVNAAKETVMAAEERSQDGAGEAPAASTSVHAAAAAEEASGPETAEEGETATVTIATDEGATALESKDKQKETAEGEATQPTAAADCSSSEAATTTDAPLQPPPPAVTRSRVDSPSIGVPDDGTMSGSAVDDSVVCNITLLLPTGARHPYRIDEKYLAKRNVDVPDVTDAGKKDPFSVSVYKLKELILREWRDDWEGKPASPSSIRLIHFGKLLDDKEQLKSMY